MADKGFHRDHGQVSVLVRWPQREVPLYDIFDKGCLAFRKLSAVYNDNR